MVARDRSFELYQIFDTCRVRQGSSTKSSVVVVSHQASASAQHVLSSEAMRFNDCAKAFGTEIAATSESIANLTKLIKQQNLFDDGSDQIGPLTAAIKSKLQQLHDDLEVLIQLKAAAVRAGSDSGWKQLLGVETGKQDAAQHSETIVNTLRSRLVKTGQDFKTVLQQRTRNLADAASRRNNLLSDAPISSESAVFGGDVAQQQQQQMAVQNSNSLYYRSRYDAVREIEAAVNEVSEIFHDFSVLVAEQNELIVRIDQDVDTALLNVNAGTNELMRYLTSVSSNRGLILKIFGILFFFLLFFGFIVVR